MPETITGNEFLDSLLERTPVAPSQPRRGQNYNYPERLYLLPSGRVAQLQGDPHNRAYYEDKGYHLLSESPGRDGRPSEVEQFTKIEYPKILAEQREKANIINAIRRAGERDRNLNLGDDEWDDLTLEEMRAEFQRIQAEYGKPIKMVRSRASERAEAAKDRMLVGVETTEQMSIEAVEQRRMARPPRGSAA
jgi:hypothetical protein